MRFSTAAAATLAGVASASWAPQYNGSAPAYVTDVVTAYTTYCPYATQFTHKGETYTVSTATTLTITNCPGGCTITRPVYSSTPVAPAPYTSWASSSSVPVAPVPYSSSSAPVAPVYPSSNGTAPVYPTGTGSAATTTRSSTPIASYTGAANKMNAAGAGLLAVVGLVAAL